MNRLSLGYSHIDPSYLYELDAVSGQLLCTTRSSECWVCNYGACRYFRSLKGPLACYSLLFYLVPDFMQICIDISEIDGEVLLFCCRLRNHYWDKLQVAVIPYE